MIFPKAYEANSTARMYNFNCLFIWMRTLPILYRIQMGRDMAWHWERPPGLDWSLEWRAGQ
jgi:hypothetical protein